jgi:hypothetical protein
MIGMITCRTRAAGTKWHCCIIRGGSYVAFSPSEIDIGEQPYMIIAVRRHSHSLNGKEFARESAHEVAIETIGP